MKSIQATQQSVEGVFRNNLFIIPDFQRPYSWDEAKCAQLFSDIASSFHDSLSNPEQLYFLGNIIYYPEPGSRSKVWNVVDGQQRLTTLLLLMRALYAKAGTQPKSLKELIYKVIRHNHDTDAGKEDEPRLESNVISEGSDYGANDLKNTLVVRQDFSGMSNKNPFKLNYERLAKNLNEWWGSNDENLENFIDFLIDSVVLLPIECEGSDDALRLFETINDRGMQLNDADIFKAKIYQAVDENRKSEFIQRWSRLKDHLNLFQAYMYILKAQDAAANDISIKRSELRGYIRDKCLENKENLKKEWESIMDSIELCHFYKTNVGLWDSDKIFSAKESIYWTILEKHPTKEYWQYPLFVFMHKHAKLGEDGLVLSPDKKQEYLDLLENTVKFFFTMGVVENNIDFVRGPSLSVCVQIEKGKDFLPTYKEKSKGNLGKLEDNLVNYSYGKSYTRGLVFLNSFLNDDQRKDADTYDAYAKAIRGKIHVEHILPKDWSHYDKWTIESHAENCNKIGNLMPLERGANIKASNEFFTRKQEKYTVSQIQDALDLVKAPPHWHPDDLKKRHEESVERLMIFFKS